MEILSQFTQYLENDSTTTRPGGILLRGQVRNNRQPIHLILLVDTSGSMELDSKINSVKKSIQVLLNLLNADDRLSLVSFHNETSTLLRQVSVTSQERQAIKYHIGRLKANGSTNMSAGLLEARDLVETGSIRKQGLILLTDGQANVGISDTPGLLQIVDRIMNEHPSLSITTVGYGCDHQTDLLTQIAKSGGGAYNVVNNLEDVASVFGDICGGLVSIVAQRIRLEFPPGFVVKTSYQTSKEPDGMTIVQVGDIYSEADATILFQGSPSLGPIRILGTDMTTLNNIDRIIEPSHANEEVNVVFLLAEIRQDVADILESVRKGLGNKNRIENRIRNIQEIDSIRDHPLIPMLKEDLEMALSMFERRNNMTQEDHTFLAQHSAYVGLSRGLRTNLSQPIGATTVATPSFVSPFANRIQRQTAHIMRNMTSQADP
jgi:Mg-chelatase subunit ChlD